ncbi:MAG: 6-phosphofructokinase, partial [Candidatus Krumholzibacteriia bacterium]
IRGLSKTAINTYGMSVVGILDGFRGLVENRTRPLQFEDVSGVLTRGGTILGTSRDKPAKMPMGGQVMDMTEVAVANARHHNFDCVVCMGGGGTQKNAWHLHQAGGLDVLTLPKTIDNDVAGTDRSFGFDTAVQTATDAIDRLHDTATSHDRMIVVEVMGNKSGWLALGAGIAGGADVVLMPEIPYHLHAVAEFLLRRQRRHGRKFSIVCVAEGAVSREEAVASGRRRVDRSDAPPDLEDHRGYRLVKESLASRLARQLQELTRTEARVTTLGHVQRGGVPAASDRLLCTGMGVKAAELLAEGVYNVMVGVRDGVCVPVPLQEVVGVRRTVPLDHAWVRTANRLGTCLGVANADLRALWDGTVTLEELNSRS